jgi:hypothetical protein
VDAKQDSLVGTIVTWLIVLGLIAGGIAFTRIDSARDDLSNWSVHQGKYHSMGDVGTRPKVGVYWTDATGKDGDGEMELGRDDVKRAVQEYGGKATTVYVHDAWYGRTVCTQEFLIPCRLHQGIWWKWVVAIALICLGLLMGYGTILGAREAKAKAANAPRT